MILELGMMSHSSWQLKVGETRRTRLVHSFLSVLNCKLDGNSDFRGVVSVDRVGPEFGNLTSRRSLSGPRGCFSSHFHRLCSHTLSKDLVWSSCCVSLRSAAVFWQSTLMSSWARRAVLGRLRAVVVSSPPPLCALRRTRGDLRAVPSAAPTAQRSPLGSVATLTLGVCVAWGGEV